ncbi:histidinol dehydrogenase [Pseudothermotoga thermarum]|uniref:Histidinol dehydrogenase n=1 Tax=Pseudothermotoga thermarum DSM 5069 TaxID=688269 RepID=F7YYR6_9THEM|nr:histidinol dehydrogenase [Pseudothermotoga thermarum]AEH51104.1 histidinol dehydrogenase [Pseudothermotoga thermarum DSM 5069]
MKITTAHDFFHFKTQSLTLNLFLEQEKIVRKIVEDVYINKDEALLRYTRHFDCPDFQYEDFVVKNEEIELAYEWCEKNDPEFLLAVKKAYENIECYHKNQLEKSWFYTTQNGSVLGQLIFPLKRVGIYVPGGKASYPSTVLMCSIPAKVANVEEIVLVSPPNKQKKLNTYVLATAKICGIDKIFKIGGAQAIAALAFGTDILPKVDKIVGPGNLYVALAKKIVFGIVDIDSIAGPSEVAIVADESANPTFIAYDLLAQAEHDPLARTFLITTSKDLATEVSRQVEDILMAEPNEIARESIENQGLIILVEKLEQVVDVVEKIAPEHLELLCKGWEDLLVKIKSAGAIFVGEFSPEAIGDYLAGPNHVLPTQGTARFFSPLGVYDFVKRTSLIKYSKSDFLKNHRHAVKIAYIEGLKFHARSLEVREKDVQEGA